MSAEDEDDAPAPPPIYDHRGPYREGFATAVKGKDYFHVNDKGERAYGESFAYVGSFSGGVAAVRRDGQEYHILPDGSPAYHARFRYVGDFVKVGNEWLAWAIKDKDRTSNTRALHIRRDGSPAYKARFASTGDFIDGVARAGLVKNSADAIPIKYFHIDPDGNPVK